MTQGDPDRNEVIAYQEVSFSIVSRLLVGRREKRSG